MTPPTDKKNAHVCLCIAQEVLAMLDNDMAYGEEASIIWRMENYAIAEFKKFGFHWQQHIGSTGTWKFPTHYREVAVHWRFEGIKSKRPTFTIGVMSWVSNEERARERRAELKKELQQQPKRKVSKKRCIRRFFFIAAAILPLLTLVFTEPDVFISCLVLAGPAIEFLVLIFGLFRSFFE